MKRTPARAIKSFVAMMMVLCLLVGTVPMAFAAEKAGTKSADITPSATKVYIRLTSAVSFFTGETYGQGTIVTPAAGEVCQLVSDNWYTGSDNNDYYSVYYQSNRYNVLKSSVSGMIMSAEALNTYITDTLWKQTTFATLRKADGLAGDVRVHALQLALQKLGYYPGNLDGSYGKITHDAVAKFQRAKGLKADGSAGPLTQPVLYALALGNSGSSSGSSGSSGTGSSTGRTGTLRTISSVNLRAQPTTESAKLDVVPKSVNLSFTDTYTPAGGVTWYQVTYRGHTGWVMGSYVSVTAGSTSTPGSSSTPVASKGTLRTNVVVNLRKYGSKSSALLGRVPKRTSLSFTDTYQSGSITWYQVTYGGQIGWLMGTYVTVTSTTTGSSGSSGSTGGATSTEPAIGKATITKASTRIRTSPNGSKSGYVLAKGTVVDLLANPVMAGDYSWHKIRTSTGLVGYVRGDCCETSIGTGTPDSGSSTVTSDKTFIRLPAATILFTEETKPATGGKAVPAGTVLMMYSAQTYLKDGVEYCSLYYNDQKYNAVYNDVKGGVMTSTEAASYMENLLNDTLADALKREYDHVGNVYVYALQSALKRLGLYTGTLDGKFGSGTQAAVTNFQRQAKLTVDGYCGNMTWTALREAIAKLNNPGSGTTPDAPSGNTTTKEEFFAGATSITKPTWDGDGVNLIKRGSYADILDIETGKIFTIYRWSGANHADCVPATRNDTKTMCDIVGFTYRDSAPSAAHLENVIKVAKDQLDDNHAWPDFGGHVYGHDIGNKWDRRAALVRVKGDSKIYAVSIYGWPHGFEGDDSFSGAHFPDGKLFYEKNNFYGMMCLHFVGSTTHGGGVIHEEHQTKINTAYNWARNNGYSSLCK